MIKKIRLPQLPASKRLFLGAVDKAEPPRNPAKKTTNAQLEELLRNLVAFETVPSNRAANNEALAYVADFLRHHGMHVEELEFDGHGTLIATTRATKTPEIMLAAHIDVVAAPQEMFNLRKVNGKYTGRGVLDMKCAIAAYLQLVTVLQDNLQNYDFGIMITSDEETGGTNGVTGTKRLLDAGYVPKVAVLPDGGQDWQLETVSNGYMHLELESRGKTAHSSRPWAGENATAKLIDTLHEIKDQFKNQGPTTDTLNVATVKSESPVNQVPDYAHAEISLRLQKAGSLKRWKQTVAEICEKHGVTVTERMSWDVVNNSLENPYVQRFAGVTEQVTGVKVTGFHSYAASDARFFAERGIPYANAYPRGGGHHGDDEWIAVEALGQLAEIIQRYVEQATKGDH